MEEKRIERLGVCMKTYADVDRQVLPIVGKCLDGMTKAAESIEPKAVSTQVEKCARLHMGHISHSAKVSIAAHALLIRLFILATWLPGGGYSCRGVGGKGLLENKNCAAQRGWSCKLKFSK